MIQVWKIVLWIWKIGICKNKVEAFEKNNKKYYVIWDSYDIPCVYCELESIIDKLDDILAVSFNTWILSEYKDEIIITIPQIYIAPTYKLWYYCVILNIKITGIKKFFLLEVLYLKEI